jgi:hypothetical protein
VYEVLCKARPHQKKVKDLTRESVVPFIILVTATITRTNGIMLVLWDA